MDSDDDAYKRGLETGRDEHRDAEIKRAHSRLDKHDEKFEVFNGWRTRIVVLFVILAAATGFFEALPMVLSILGL